VKTVVDSLGWTAEFRIPLSQLRFDKDQTSWGFQVYRRIQRKAEEVYWAPYSKEASGFASLFGELEGLEGLSSPMRLEVRPYTVVNTRRRPEASGDLYAPTGETQFDGGVDVKYGLTSDFTLDLAVNPDFGQVEADPSRVNLTAFELFFPEKRPFFVEGSGLFNRWVPPGQLFYSRRIGRRPQGFASPPDGGTVEIPEASMIISAAKVTGKTAGGLGLGIMSALTAHENAALRDSMGTVMGSERVEPFTHYFAGRVEQDFREGSHTVGGMFTAVNRRLSDNLDFLRTAGYMGTLDGAHRWHSNTYAVRWQFAASHIRGSTNAITRAQRSSFRYYQRPDAPHVELDTTRTSLSGYALELSAGKEAGTWQYSGWYNRVSPGFDISDMGFLGQADAQQVGLYAQYLRARPQGIFRNYRLRIGMISYWRTSGEKNSTWFRPVYFRATFRNNWSLGINPMGFSWVPLQTLRLRGGPALRGDTRRNSFIFVNTDPRKRVALEFFASAGGDFATRRRQASFGPSLEIRPSGLVNVTVSLDYDWNRKPIQWVGRRTALDSTRYILAEIDQQTLSLTARLNWTLSPTLSVQFYGQPFVSAGRYSAFKEVIAPRASAFDDRFRVYADELACADGLCEVDLDLDGTADFSFGQPDFNFKQLRSTLVLRWEYRPGSVLFFAWQHGRSAFLNDGAFGGFSDLGDIFREDSDNTFLIKINYWLSF
ncbi:MAG: DUF5916 domain-containing protein, partial [Acidimicrobiia bacterium]